MPDSTAIQWLKDFNESVHSTRCKVEGREASLHEGFVAAESLLGAIREAEGTVWWVGNGGSSALCSHLSQDVLNKLRIRSLVLNDPALLTCMANDFGYENVYSRPLELLVRPGDLLIAISSSGKSANILACAELARRKGMKLISLSGFDASNPLWHAPADIAFYLPSTLYGQVEVGHETLVHSILETMWLNDKARAARKGDR